MSLLKSVIIRQSDYLRHPIISLPIFYPPLYPVTDKALPQLLSVVWGVILNLLGQCWWMVTGSSQPLIWLPSTDKCIKLSSRESGESFVLVEFMI